MKEKQNFDKENSFGNTVKSLTITQLAHLHLYDRNHVTNDEELRNAKIELSNVVSGNENNNFITSSSTILD